MTVAPAVEPSIGRVALAALAPLFRYPEESLPKRIDEARLLFPSASAAAADALERFASAISVMDTATMQSTYTHTFDLAPSCSPYLGAHLFGDETRDRARLMVGLRMTYRRGGVDLDDRELPDHLAEVLAFAERYEEDEWRELASLVLLPSLGKMEQILRTTSNPYRHLLESARGMVMAVSLDGGAS